MATKSTVPTVANGDSWSAAQQNTYLRDNIEALWPYTTAGDIAYATASNQLARLGKPSVDSVLKNTGTGTLSWLAISDFLHFASVYHNTTQNVPTATPTAIVFNSEYSDDQGWHSTSSNTSRITVTANGYYQVSCYLLYTSTGGSGFYWDTIELRRNGSIVAKDRRKQELDAYDKMFSVTFPIIAVNAGQYLEIYLEQNSGGTRTIVAGAMMSVLRVK